jgi:hypothetical protein
LATEGLWMARIDPRSPGNVLLLPADVRAIARGLQRAIARDPSVPRTARAPTKLTRSVSDAWTPSRESDLTAA